MQLTFNYSMSEPSDSAAVRKPSSSESVYPVGSRPLMDSMCLKQSGQTWTLPYPSTCQQLSDSGMLSSQFQHLNVSESESEPSSPESESYEIGACARTCAHMIRRPLTHLHGFLEANVTWPGPAPNASRMFFSEAASWKSCARTASCSRRSTSPRSAADTFKCWNCEDNIPESESCWHVDGYGSVQVCPDCFKHMESIRGRDPTGYTDSDDDGFLTAAESEGSDIE
eukprot:COSAG03_NODE_866_length_5583_cov_57.343545_3_plen_226_part_00